jgi:hypothetical protein
VLSAVSVFERWPPYVWFVILFVLGMALLAAIVVIITQPPVQTSSSYESEQLPLSRAIEYSTPERVARAGQSEVR